MPQEKCSRRDFLAITCLASVGVIVPKAWGRIPASTRELTLYIGTYTSGKSEGIYIYRMSLDTGELTHVKTIKGVVDPSFLAIDRQRRRLYAVNEVDQFAGKPSGALSAFSIEKDDDLRFLNQQPTLGGSPCHLIVDKTSRFVLVANYTGGNISVFPIRANGSIGEASQMIQHHGSSVNKERQEGPHAHCIELDTANRYAFAVDLGLDKIMAYEFDARNGHLTANKTPSVQMKPGDGPRHLTFHPNGRYAYVINELSSTVTAFAYNHTTGNLRATQTVSTLPADFSSDNTTAEVVVSPSGKFLYGSNRGHDSIVGFAIDQNTGKLTYIEHVPAQGKTPRNFTIDPTAKFLLVANQASDTIVSLRINPVTGRLESTGHMAQVPTPVCLLFK